VTLGSRVPRLATRWTVRAALYDGFAERLERGFRLSHQDAGPSLSSLPRFKRRCATSRALRGFRRSIANGSVC